MLLFEGGVRATIKSDIWTITHQDQCRVHGSVTEASAVRLVDSDNGI
jgi:hypothetical protein